MKRLSFFAANLLVLVAATGSAQSAPDTFADACMARGNASRSVCECQAKLARTGFNPQERQMAIVAMRGNGEAFRASLAKMDEPKRKSFIGKMQKLKGQTEAQCR